MHTHAAIAVIIMIIKNNEQYHNSVFRVTPVVFQQEPRQFSFRRHQGLALATKLPNP
jgi:hypothetical protein